MGSCMLGICCLLHTYVPLIRIRTSVSNDQMQRKLSLVHLYYGFVMVHHLHAGYMLSLTYLPLIYVLQ